MAGSFTLAPDGLFSSVYTVTSGLYAAVACWRITVNVMIEPCRRGDQELGMDHVQVAVKNSELTIVKKIERIDT